MRAMGQSLTSRGSMDSQGGKRKRNQFEDLHDEKVLVDSQKLRMGTTKTIVLKYNV